MNTRQLETFAVLAETRSIHKAAKRLYLTPPSVKHLIDSLETESGLVLFTRSRAGMDLTASGEVFLVYVRRALECLNDGLSAAARKEAVSPNVILAPHVGKHIVRSLMFSKALVAYKDAHPNVDFAFSVTDSLVGDHFDVTNDVLGDYKEPVVSLFLETLPVFCKVSLLNPLSSRQCVTTADLDPFELLVPDDDHVAYLDEKTRDYVRYRQSISRKTGFAVTTSHSTDNESDVWCILHDGVALELGDWDEPEPSSMTARIPLVDAGFSYYMHYTPNPKPVVRQYIDFIMDFYGRR